MPQFTFQYLYSVERIRYCVGDAVWQNLLHVPTPGSISCR